MFEYEKRPDADIMEGFAPGGAPFVKSLRLKRIDTNLTGTVARSYNLEYEEAPNGVSRLARLQECLPPASAPTAKR